MIYMTYKENLLQSWIQMVIENAPIIFQSFLVSFQTLPENIIQIPSYVLSNTTNKQKQTP